MVFTDSAEPTCLYPTEADPILNRDNYVASLTDWADKIPRCCCVPNVVSDTSISDTTTPQGAA